MSIVRLLNLILSLILKGISVFENWRKRRQIRKEIEGELLKEKDATNVKVRSILDKLDSDPAYREEMLRKIRERAHKAQ